MGRVLLSSFLIQPGPLLIRCCSCTVPSPTKKM